MPLVLRNIKNAELTWTEVDGNFVYLENKIDDLEQLVNGDEVVKVTAQSFLPGQEDQARINIKAASGQQLVDLENRFNDLENMGVVTYAVQQPTPQQQQTARENVKALSTTPNGNDLLIGTNNKIADVYLPDSLFGQLKWGGNFDENGIINATADFNLIDQTDIRNLDTVLYEGVYFIASLPNDISLTVYGIEYSNGDWAVASGNIDKFNKANNSDSVTSVAGKRGVVLLGISDITGLFAVLLNKVSKTGNENVSGVKSFQNKLSIQGISLESNNTDNFNVNAEINTIDNQVIRSVISGGGDVAFPNRIGTKLKPTGTPPVAISEWSNDVNYPLGIADVAIITGGYDNVNNQEAGTISGGAHNYLKYHLQGHGLIGGGSYNTNAGGRSTIVAGYANEITSNTNEFGLVVNGYNNVVSASFATVLNGYQNKATNTAALVLGGTYNIANGDHSIVWGIESETSGDFSVALGRKVKNTARGSFVFSDSQNVDFNNNIQDAFVGRFSGGYRFTGGLVESDSGNVGGGYYHKNSSNANSRRYRTITDINTFGDFVIQKSTTQSGNTFEDIMWVLPNKNIEFFGRVKILNAVNNDEAVALEQMENYVDAAVNAIPAPGNGNITYTGVGAITGGGTSSADQSANTDYDFDLTAQTKSDIQTGVDAASKIESLFGGLSTYFKNTDVSGGGNFPTNEAFFNLFDPGLAAPTVGVGNHDIDGARLVLQSHPGGGVPTYNGNFIYENNSVGTISLENGKKVEFVWVASIGKWKEVL